MSSGWRFAEHTHARKVELLQQLHDTGLCVFRQSRPADDGQGWVYELATVVGERVLAARDVEPWVEGVADGVRAAGSGGRLPWNGWPEPPGGQD